MDQLDYLVSHGLLGDFGRFRPERPLTLRGGSRVLVRTGRGVEVGEVLRPATSRHSTYLPEGGVLPLLRAVTEEDEVRLGQQADRARRLLRRAEELRDGLGMPAELLDAEVLFEGEQAVILYVCRGQADLREMVRPLSRDFEVNITLMDLSEPAAEEDHGCGSCGSGGCGSCGTGGGGCGSGSCGSMRPDEVQDHFAELRKKMEMRRVPLL